MEGGVVRAAIAGGGTGGHVFPALSVTRELRAGADQVQVQVLWLGQADSLDPRTAAAGDINCTAVAVGKPRRDRHPPPRAAARAVVTGNPIRESVLAGSGPAALDRFGRGFDRRLPTVLVTGGAQGAHQINTAIADMLTSLLDQANVIHQAGAADLAGL